MHITDTHCHIHEADMSQPGDMLQGIWAKAPDANPDAMIARAQNAGVTRLLCVGTSAADSEKAVAFVQPRAGCWATIGIHPHEAKDGQPAFNRLAKLAGKLKVVAVGECGLDYFYNHSGKADQAKALRFQIELALEHNLPMIFHVREAFDDFWPIFDSYQGIRGVLHSFTDTQATMEQGLARGLYIGANGIMTFTKDPAHHAMIKAVPLQKLLVETDSPFLTPVPFRGTVNEPAHAKTVASFLADLRGETLEQLAEATTRNAQTLFTLN